MIKFIPEIIHLNGTTKVKVTARDERTNELIEAETLTLESSLSRNRFAKRLAQLTGQPADELARQLLALVDAKPEAPTAPAAPDAAALLAAMPEENRKDAADLLSRPSLIEEIKADFRRMGIVGDERTALALYFCATSRLLDKPVSAITRGATSGGKSFIGATIAKLFPPEAKLEAHHLSSKAFYYMPDDALKHKAVFAGERARRQDDESADATKALREMLSDGVLRAAVTEKIDGELKTLTFEKHGPIAFIESTSAATIFAEDENRCLCLYVDESPNQTRSIITATAQAAAGNQPDVSADVILTHHAMQRMLKPLAVKIPYAPTLAEHFPTARVEARRAMPHLLGMIRAVALLRQFQKQIVGGAILADVEDYRVALEVIAPTLARLTGALDEQARRVFDAILNREDKEEEFTRRAASCWAGITESDCGGRLRLLVSAGYLIETAEHKGSRPAKYKLAHDATAIPAEAATGLPTADELAVMCGHAPPGFSSRQQFHTVITDDLSALTTNRDKSENAETPVITDDLSAQADKTPENTDGKRAGEFVDICAQSRQIASATESEPLSAGNSSDHITTHNPTEAEIAFDLEERAALQAGGM